MSRNPVRPWWFMAFIAASVVFATSVAAAPSTQSIEQSVRRAMEEFNVPGMAVSVVKDGEVYYSAGLGVVETGKKQGVDDRTLFQIGSVSKAFTAASLALLADEGKLEWDDPVIDHLPEFRMNDPWVTREFTIRDLLTHRSGLPIGAGDLLIFPEAETSRDEIVHAMRYLKPASSFRSKFAYDNLLYIVAGEVVARVADTSFEEFLERRLLGPLGMDDCVATLERAPRNAVKAIPHVLVDGVLETTGSGITSTAAAAGGINCSARSMTLWMTFVLNEGVSATGDRLLSEVQFAEWVAPVTLLASPAYFVEHAGAHLRAYALGWDVSTFHGQPSLSHGGGVWGMTTYLMILPGQGLAVFASGNQMSAAPRAVVNDVVERFLAGTGQDAGKDWIAILSERVQSRQAEGAETVAQAAAARAEESQPNLPLEAYAGTYRDAWYGDIQVTLESDGRLWFRSGRSKPLQGPLEHFQYDTFIARWSDRKLNADAYVSFSLTPEGGVEGIRMKAVSPTTDFSFDFHDLDLERAD